MKSRETGKAEELLRMFGGSGLVICFDFQRAMLEESLAGLVEFQTMRLENVRQRFGI